MSYSTVSIRGGKHIVQTLQRIAGHKSAEAGRRVTVGELVYNAVFETYGDEYAEAFSFFVEDGNKMHQLKQSDNKEQES